MTDCGYKITITIKNPDGSLRKELTGNQMIFAIGTDGNGAAGIVGTYEFFQMVQAMDAINTAFERAVEHLSKGREAIENHQ